MIGTSLAAENPDDDVRLHREGGSHAHVVVGFSDGSTKGGHLLEARVWPTLEVFVTAAPRALVKTFDRDSGLDVIDPSR